MFYIKKSLYHFYICIFYMANKKTHKKINKIKLKKNNKSKRKYKKKVQVKQLVD